MCFSMEASFAGAGALAIVGIATLNLAKAHRHLLLLAAMPFLFAIQQAGEGIVWLGFNGIIDSKDILAFGKDVFLTFAYAIWPIYVPIAMYIAETETWRKWIMAAMGLLGVAVVMAIFTQFSLSSVTPTIVNHSIRYISEPTLPSKLGYLAAVTLPFFFSSLQHARIFAAVLTIAFFAANYFYFVTFTSVWCFFGAIFSLGLYWVIKPAVASAPRTIA